MVFIVFFNIRQIRWIRGLCDFSVTLLIHELLELIEVRIDTQKGGAEDKELCDEHEYAGVYLPLRRKEKPCGSKCHRRAKCEKRNLLFHDESVCRRPPNTPIIQITPIILNIFWAPFLTHPLRRRYRRC